MEKIIQLKYREQQNSAILASKQVAQNNSAIIILNISNINETMQIIFFYVRYKNIHWSSPNN